MNRYAFYFVVALLAFVVGIGFVYFCFYKLNYLETLSAFTQVEMAEPSHPDLADLEKSSAEIRPVSGLEIILLLYKPTIEKWKKGEKIPPIVKPSSEIIEQINKLSERYTIAKELAICEIYKSQAIDLNNDGKKELIVFQKTSDRTFDDKPFWRLTIFEQLNDGIGVIFDEGGMQNYRISKTKTNGFSDIELIIEENPTSVYVEVFKSSGKEYNILSCYEKTYRYKDKNGKWHKLKKPRIEFGDDCC